MRILSLKFMRRATTALFILFSISVLLFSQHVAAFTKNDFYCATTNTCFYQPDACSGNSQATATQSVGDVKPGSVYILGDSITNIAKDKYKTSFNVEDGWDLTVRGLDSRHMSQNSPKPSGLDQLDKDKGLLKNTNAIVIALGTNDTGNSKNSNEDDVKDIMTKVKEYNVGDAPIYWINVYNDKQKDDSEKINKIISDGVGNDGTVIDWYTAAKSEADVKSFGEGVHPTKDADIKLLVNLLHAALAGPGKDSDSVAGADEQDDPCTCTTNAKLSGSDNAEKTWNFFKGKGLSDQQTAGIMGNLTTESHFDPQIIQNGGRSKNPSDAGGGGWGLIQWTPGSKVIGLLQQSKVKGEVYELSTQLELVWQHMHNNPVVTRNFDLKYFKTLNTPLEASQYFGQNIEGFGIEGNRNNDAQTAYDKYAKGGGSGSGGGETGGSDCSGASPAGSPDCQNATGNEKILCEAKKYDKVSYVWGGGHAGGSAYHKACSKIDTSVKCGLDCSGLVSVAIYDAFSGSGSLAWDTNSLRSDSAHWKAVDFNELKPGDVIEPDDGHVEIIDHVSGNTIHTFGAHTAKKPQPEQVGPTQYTNKDGYKFFRYKGN